MVGPASSGCARVQPSLGTVGLNPVTTETVTVKMFPFVRSTYVDELGEEVNFDFTTHFDSSIIGAFDLYHSCRSIQEHPIPRYNSPIMLTIEETRALGEVHPEFEPIVRCYNPMLNAWNMDTDLYGIREIMTQVRQARPKPDLDALSYRMEDIKIPLRDGHEVDARVYTPKDAPSDGCPGIIVFHGGGFMLGDLDTEAGLCATFTDLGGVAVNVDFRHAPEHPFPQAIEDAFDATNWATKNVSKLGIDPAKGFIIGGTSSGADMSLAVAHLCQDAGMEPPLTGVYAPITSGVNEETVPEKYKDHFFSKEQNANAPVFSTESLKFVHSKYKPDQTSPLAFPVAFPTHVGQPKTYFQVCGLDPVRDCSLVLEQVYKDDGVPTKIHIYPGLPHAFWALFPELEISSKRQEDVVEGLKWLLEQ